MATFGRTTTGVNRGGPQSSRMHKGVGLNKWSGGLNAQGSQHRVAYGDVPTWTAASTPSTAAQTVATPSPATTPAPTPFGSPGLVQRVDGGATPSPSAAPASGAVPNAGNVATAAPNTLPPNIEALIQQLLGQANAKVAEAQTFAQQEQQRAREMIQGSMGGFQSQMASVQPAVQNMLASIMQQVTGMGGR